MSAFDDLTSWLLDPAARDLPADRFVDALADHLLAAGVPVTWASTGIHTLHPEVALRNVRWAVGEGTTTHERHHELRGVSEPQEVFTVAELVES